MNIRFIVTASRIVIGCIFMIACIPKILDPADFSLIIFRYQLMPHDGINLLALLLPCLEFFCALGLWFGRRFRAATALLVILMLCLFTTAIGINMARDINIACGCFSVDPNAGDIGAQNIARNLGILFLTALVFANALKDSSDGGVRRRKG